MPKLPWHAQRETYYIAGQYQAGQDAPEMTNTFWIFLADSLHVGRVCFIVFWLNSTRQCYIDCDPTTKYDGNQRNEKQVLNHSPLSRTFIQISPYFSLQNGPVMPTQRGPVLAPSWHQAILRMPRKCLKSSARRLGPWRWPNALKMSPLGRMGDRMS